MSDLNGQERDRQQRVYNLTLAAVASQVGCLTIVIIFGALIVGLWLDRTFLTKPLFTILLMVASMPVTLYVMFRVAQSAANRIRPVMENKNPEKTEGGSKL